MAGPARGRCGRTCTIAEGVYRALKRDILCLRHPPGTPLREQELAEKYGSSRVPVREACRRLQQEGLVEAFPYRGYFASPISLKEIGDCFDLRLVLETHGLRLAVERATEEDVGRIEKLAGSEYRYHDRDSYLDFLGKNLEFHVTLSALSGNARLTKVLRDLIESMQRFFFLGLELGDFGPEMRREHEALAAFLDERDRKRATECLRGQIERSRERILTALLKERADLPVL